MISIDDDVARSDIHRRTPNRVVESVPRSAGARRRRAAPDARALISTGRLDDASSDRRRPATDRALRRQEPLRGPQRGRGRRDHEQRAEHGASHPAGVRELWLGQHARRHPVPELPSLVPLSFRLPRGPRAGVLRFGVSGVAWVPAQARLAIRSDGSLSQRDNLATRSEPGRVHQQAMVARLRRGPLNWYPELSTGLGGLDAGCHVGRVSVNGRASAHVQRRAPGHMTPRGRTRGRRRMSHRPGRSRWSRRNAHTSGRSGLAPCWPSSASSASPRPRGSRGASSSSASRCALRTASDSDRRAAIPVPMRGTQPCAVRSAWIAFATSSSVASRMHSRAKWSRPSRNRSVGSRRVRHLQLRRRFAHANGWRERA